MVENRLACILPLLLLVGAVLAASDNSNDVPMFSAGDESKIPPNPNKPPPGGQSLKVPKLTDEEKYSKRLPDSLLCDACEAVAYQLSLALSKAEGKVVSSRRGKPLRESEYLEVMEEVCIQEWKDYGIKDVDGVHQLSGPGLPAENHFSMMYGGGDWPARLERKCREILGEVGEDEIYELFRSDNSLKVLCREHSIDCERMRKKKKTKKRKDEL